MSRLTSLSDAARLINDGDHVALSGFSIARNAMALAHELVRRDVRGLTISACILGLEADLLVGAGCVGRVIYGGGSLDRFGQLGRVNEAVERGRIEVEYMSSLAVTFRYLAGSLGLPYIPIRSLLASDLVAPLVAAGVAREDRDPFGGEQVVLLRALEPDAAILHAQVADADGNTRVLGPRWDNDEAVAAAKRVIVLAEEVVEPIEIRRSPELTLVPAFRVTALVHVPFGAHPTAVYRRYDYDAEHLALYADATRSQRTFDEYLARYVRGTDHAGYLAAIGGAAKLATLTADPGLGY
ncbi:MAG TPA: CoA-transferase [Candidatus Limnocylindria bacterium]|nr:CoA-transferase [Candidatus Limnocylindria bacterium]